MAWSTCYQVFKERDAEHKSLEDTHNLRGSTSNSNGTTGDDKISRENIKIAEKSRMHTFTAVVSATSRAASPAFAKRLTQPAHNQSLWSHKSV